jgi:hypothetical protein
MKIIQSSAKGPCHYGTSEQLLTRLSLLQGRRLIFSHLICWSSNEVAFSPITKHLIWPLGSIGSHASSEWEKVGWARASASSQIKAMQTTILLILMFGWSTNHVEDGHSHC